MRGLRAALALHGTPRPVTVCFTRKDGREQCPPRFAPHLTLTELPAARRVCARVGRLDIANVMRFVA